MYVVYYKYHILGPGGMGKERGERKEETRTLFLEIHSFGKGHLYFLKEQEL